MFVHTQIVLTIDGCISLTIGKQFMKHITILYTSSELVVSLKEDALVIPDILKSKYTRWHVLFMCSESTMKIDDHHSSSGYHVKH